MTITSCTHFVSVFLPISGGCLMGIIIMPGWGGRRPGGGGSAAMGGRPIGVGGGGGGAGCCGGADTGTGGGMGWGLAWAAGGAGGFDTGTLGGLGADVMGGGTADLVPGGGGRDCMPLTDREPTGFGPIFSFSSSGNSPFTLWIWWICSSKVMLARAALVAASTLDVCPSHVTCTFMCNSRC